MGGCCTSKKTKELSPAESEIVNDEEISDNRIVSYDLCPEFAISDFPEEIVFGDNGVYKEEIQNFVSVAVKKLDKDDWPYEVQFAKEAHRVYELRHARFAKFLGYCCGEKEKKKLRLLVAEFLPYDNLAKRLFHEKSEIMEWGTRLRVAYCVAEAVDFCRNASVTYKNLSAYKILFDKDGDACLSCFGLVKEINNDQTAAAAGSVNSGSVTHRFGVVLLNLLTEKQIPPSHATEMINVENVLSLMDPNLEGKFVDEEATVVFEIASKCLQHEDTESINTKDIVATLKAMQKIKEVPSFEMAEKHEEEASSSSQQGQSEIPSSVQLSPLGEACSRKDLDAIHEILVMAGYKDDKEVSEYSFEECLPKTDGDKTVGQLGDEAFKEKNFDIAIQRYTQSIEAREVVLQSLYARRCLSYLFCNMIEEATDDMIKAQEMYLDWPTGHYLMSVVLSKAGKTAESARVFEQATLLERNREES